jgi:hypothetical protein
LDLARPELNGENLSSSTAQEPEKADKPGLAVVSKPLESEKASDSSVGKTVEKDPVVSGLSLDSREVNQSTLITVDEAKQQISKEILSALADKFNGKLSEVRPVDDKDILFGADPNKNF